MQVPHRGSEPMKYKKFKNKSKPNTRNSNKNSIEPSNRTNGSLLYLICKVCLRVLRIYVIIMRSKHISQVIGNNKVQGPYTTKSVIIYQYKCSGLDCDEKYIGESAKTFKERLNEYSKTSLLIYGHQPTTDHTMTLHNFKIMGRKGQYFARTIKEFIYIRVNNPILNRNKGKYNMSHIWDGALFNTWEFKMKNQWELPQHREVHTSLAPSRTFNTYEIADNNIFLQNWWGHSGWLVKACL